MLTRERRKVLKSFLTVPLLSLAGKVNLFGQILNGTSETDQVEAFQSRYLAVQILRHINTAQLWFKAEYGHFGQLSELNDSFVMERFLQDKRVEKAGLGTTFHSRLQFSQKEILPGWSFKFGSYGDQMGYLARISPTGSNETVSFSTDETGLIYQGKALDEDPQEASQGARATLDSATPIVTSRSVAPNRLVRALRNMAVSPDFFCIGCSACGPPVPCCCGDCCSCQAIGIAGQCINCGCPSCVWCCCLF